MKEIVVIANLDNGVGMSGGTRIYYELLKKLGSSFGVVFFGSNGTINRIKQEKIENIKYIETDLEVGTELGTMIGLFTHTVRRLVGGIMGVRRHYKKVRNVDYVFSVSDFWPEILPALFLKWKNPKIKWVAAFYFFAPKPWQKDNPYATTITRRSIGFIYWFTQQLAYHVIKRWADLIISCNEIDRRIFIKNGYPTENIISIYGGVDLPSIKKVLSPKRKLYDAVFMARFHPQKGPLIAVKVWKEIVKTMPSAKLAMIGNGPEESAVKSYIELNHLERNVELMGYLDGVKKYKILKSSRIFIHPAIYETGGMAAAEGMACELPVVAFNHEGFEFCYPQGMVRVSPIGDIHKFAKATGDLLKNKKRYDSISQQALNLIKREWDWDKRASFIQKKLSELATITNKR